MVRRYRCDIGYSLAKLYPELSELEARSVYVFLDACFSGAQRDGETLASVRGVTLKPQPASPRGNMVVFSAASDDETALPYEDKGHGLFTYYLLKTPQIVPSASMSSSWKSMKLKP